MEQYRVQFANLEIEVNVQLSGIDIAFMFALQLPQCHCVHETNTLHNICCCGLVQQRFIG